MSAIVCLLDVIVYALIMNLLKFYGWSDFAFSLCFFSIKFSMFIFAIK